MAFITTDGSDDSLISAIARTFSGMPTFVYAPCTDTSIGIDSICIRWTVSMIGIRQARPPNTTRDPVMRPVGQQVLAAREDQDLRRAAQVQEARDPHER